MSLPGADCAPRGADGSVRSCRLICTRAIFTPWDLGFAACKLAERRLRSSPLVHSLLTDRRKPLLDSAPRARGAAAGESRIPAYVRYMTRRPGKTDSNTRSPGYERARCIRAPKSLCGAEI